MNKIKFFTMAALAATVMTSCNNDDEAVNNSGRVEVKFSAKAAQVETRVNETNWAANDPIGIYMVDATAGTLTAGNIVESVDNRQYKAAAAGANPDFTQVGGTIYYPATGNVKFLAYYPYSSSVTADFKLPVSVSSQSSLSAIDVLYAPVTSTSYSGSTASTPVALAFVHKLVKLVFNISNGTGVTEAPANGMTVTIPGQQTAGVLDLTNGVVTSSGASTSISATGTATVEAIVLPLASTSGITFSFTNNAGESFTGSMPSTTPKWEGGNKYTYTVTLQKSTTGTAATIKGTISAWGDGGSGSVTAE